MDFLREMTPGNSEKEESISSNRSLENSSKPLSSFSVDVEDWFHILDSPATPSIDAWNGLESRVDRNVNRLLDLLDEFDVKATFFWLGWIAEQNRSLLERCVSAGHEIASHGYAHELPYQVGSERFRSDISHSKNALEQMTGTAIEGYRAPGFGITNQTPWAFDIIHEAGFTYDSSVFPATRGHGGMSGTELAPHSIRTPYGDLIELPIPVVEILGRRLSLFGGGYLRLAPLFAIKRGIRSLHTNERPLISYIHPREIDPDHPRLPLNIKRRFKSYVKLKSTERKLIWILENNRFQTMSELARETRISLGIKAPE